MIVPRKLVFATETAKKNAVQLSSSELAPLLRKLETRILAHPEQGKREAWVTDNKPRYHRLKQGIFITKAYSLQLVNGRSQMEFLYKYDARIITVEGICFAN